MSQRRLDEIRRQLPESLDLLAVSVGAGLGLQGALANVAEHSEGALATEWRRVLGDIRLGASLVEALSGLAARADIAEVRHFVASVILAVELGASLGPVLRAQAAHARAQRHLRISEKAHTIPVKVLFPLVLCLLPALLLVVLGPPALTIVDELGGATRL